MGLLHEQVITCPYCDEPLDVLIDPEDVGQGYIEDCQVCCRPINFVIGLDDEGEPVASVHSENDM